MAIANDQELRAAAETAGVLLQEIQDYLVATNRARSSVDEARVRFPRRFIRTAASQRDRLGFVVDQALKDNLAYTLMLSDAILWLIVRTDLFGVPKEMLRKLYAFLVGALVESITKEYLRGICGKNYESRTKFLVDNGVIQQGLKDELDWLWATRNRMHLFQLSSREYENDYDDACHTRAVAVFRNLLRVLAARGRLNAGERVAGAQP